MFRTKVLRSALVSGLVAVPALAQEAPPAPSAPAAEVPPTPAVTTASAGSPAAVSPEVETNPSRPMALSCAPRFTLVAGRCIPCCPPGEVCTTRILCKPDSTSAEPVPPVDPHAHLHDGLYLRVGLGVGVMSTSWKPAGGETQDRNAWGMIPVELAVGSAPVPGLTIGLGFYGALGAPSLLAALGPFVDIHPNPRHGFHLEAALTHAVLHLNLPADDCRQVATAGQCVHGDSVEYTGRALALVMGIGYEGWVSAQTSVGGLLRMQYVTTVMTATPAGFADTPVSSAMPAALFTVTYQ